MNFNRIQKKKVKDEIANPNRDNKTYYEIVSNLGVTFGSIVDDFRLWLINDFKKFAPIKKTYIHSQLTGTQDFYLTEGMLIQVEKPNLSLQFSINHINTLTHFNTPAFQNFEAINYLKANAFMDSVIFCDDGKNSIDIKLSFKPIRIDVNSIIVTQSRYQADNITHAWNIRRNDNVAYSSKFYVDFEIPEHIIQMLYDKFKISTKTHRPMLKWLNKHCPYPVYYSLNTYNAKPGFFFKYIIKPLIRPTGLQNPQPINEVNNQLSEMWAITRSFEMDVVVPSILAVSGHVIPELTDNYKFDTNENFEDDVAKYINNERVQEYSLQIEDKHALFDFHISLEDEDIITTKSGKKISKKIMISDAITEQPHMNDFIKWGESYNLTPSDLFDFVVHKNTAGIPYSRLGIGHTISDAMKTLNMTIDEYKEFTSRIQIPLHSDDKHIFTIDDLDIPNTEMEYDHYIKNNDEIWFIDLRPEPNESFTVVVYISIRLFNQFVMETKITRQDVIDNDDIANEYPQGNNKTLNDIQDRY